jgi:hypothetical protein
MSETSYHGNINLKPEGYQHVFTKEEITEYIRCQNDPLYFIENYCHVVSVDHGLILFKLHPIQRTVVETILGNRKTIVMQPRQTGKTVTSAACILWYTIFQEAKTVAILANKGSAAREVLNRYQIMFEHLPLWMQQGVKTWNKGDIELENGSKVFTAATSASAIRGKTVSWLYIDEAAIIQNNIAEDFFASVYPTISSGQTTKILLTSTPLGYNHFWKFWNESEEKKNDFVSVRVHYWDIPGRDEKWAEEQLRQLGELKFNQEILCLGGDAPVTVRNTETGEVFETSLAELYDMLKQTKFEILTPSGFQKFDGLTKRRDHALEISLSDGTTTKCSFTHRWINKDNREVEAQYLCVGDELYANITITKIQYIGKIDLYDPVNVGGGNVYLSQGHAHHNCEFLGSSNTLINAKTLARLSSVTPLSTTLDYDLYEQPIEGHTYIIICDVAEGVLGDYSAFLIFDVTDSPYKIVGKYRNNTISPMLFPDVIFQAAKKYNEAYVLVETNVGAQVVDILFNDLEYDRVVSTVSVDGRTFATAGFGTGGRLGVKMNKQVKRIGCSTAKSIVEEQKILLNDAHLISELSTFVSVNNSYKADAGYHDDLAMCLIIFGWLSTNQYFKELTDVDMRKKMYEEQMRQIEENLTPFGVIKQATDTDDMFVETNKKKKVVWYASGVQQDAIW